jgi:hypothetical protein
MKYLRLFEEFSSKENAADINDVVIHLCEEADADYKLLFQSEDILLIYEISAKEEQLDLEHHLEMLKSIDEEYNILKKENSGVTNLVIYKGDIKDAARIWLNQFNDLTPVEKGDIIYYVDKDRLPLFYYYQDEENDYVYINHDRIWSFFSNVIGLEYEEIKGIMKDWLEDTYNLRGLTPIIIGNFLCLLELPVQYL